jgi:myo-inositol 2-dehydrogenase/D-chiro-inositol 1-dehydrogenase
MKRVSIGIIGCGAIAESEHIPNILSISQAKLVGICDINKNKLDEIGDKFNISARYVHFEELIERKDIDAVIIATPAPTHAEIVLKSLDYGKKVFVEKPIAVSIEDAENIVNLSRKVSLPVMVGYQLRFLPNHQKVKEFIRKGMVGQIYTARIRAETLVIKPAETLLIDYATHFFDLMNWYFDKEKIESIAGTVKEDEKKTQVASTTILNYASGFYSTIESIWVPKFSWGIVSRFFEVVGENGKISTDTSGPRISLWRASSLRDRVLGMKNFNPQETVNSFMPLSDYCYREELKAFVDSVIGNKPVSVTAEDGLKALKIADATFRSYEQKKLIQTNGL